MLKSELAPIVLFVYNRPFHTLQTLEALMANDLADKSDLYIYSDGPKLNSSQEELEKINDVQKVIRAKKWCKTVNILKSETNKGLATSIITGVTEIINKFGKVIVLEDDLIVSPGFLNFMNKALGLYEREFEVMHISGYSYPLFRKENGIYFLKYVTSWGWATWADRWCHLETDAMTLFEKLKQKRVNWTDFNSGFGKTFEIQLLANIDSRYNTWAVKWHSSVYLNNGLTLFPSVSLVRNVGFDKSGTHMNALNKILGNQNIDIGNNFKYIKPYFNQLAYWRLNFFYFINRDLIKTRNKILKKIKKTFH